MEDSVGLLILLAICVIWGVFGIWGASILKGKGRSSGAGFALGLILGPVGLVIAMLMGPSADHLAQRYAVHARAAQSPRGLRAAEGIGWYCERCGVPFNDSPNAFVSFEGHVCEAPLRGGRMEPPPATTPASASTEGVGDILVADQKTADLSSTQTPPAELVQRLISQRGAVCQGCDRQFDDSLYLELAHNTPVSDGGLDHISNMLLLCGPCNRIKMVTR